MTARPYIKKIADIWQHKDDLASGGMNLSEVRDVLEAIVEDLDKGIIRTCTKTAEGWQVNGWIKQAIMLFFKFSSSKSITANDLKWFDKVPLKLSDWSDQQFMEHQLRAVPGAYVRKGSYIGNNVVLMPCFVNIGAYVGDNTMIDTWSTVGSCAQIGANCHIAGGVGIAGVLEPVQSRPVIIEDNCFIGARSQIAEGVIVEEGSVIGMGTYIGASTKIVDRETGNILGDGEERRVPAYSVVVPGSLPNADPTKPSLNCAVIIKRVDEKVRARTAINDLLRG